MNVQQASGTTEIPDRVVEELARNLIDIDDSVTRTQSTVELLLATWSQMRRTLARRVLALAPGGYVMSDLVREALGGEFAVGPVHEAAIRAGFLDRPTRGDLTLVETETGAGVLAAIEHCLGDES